MMPREINAEGYALIKEFEQGPNGGPALMPYYCPAGKLTNGWGNTHGVVPGQAITLEQAQDELKRIKRGALKAGKTTRAKVWRRS